MGLGEITMLMREGIQQVLLMCAPVLGAAVIVGLIVAIFQATTSIQEQTLTFLPKLMIILLMLALLGGWLFGTMENYTLNLFARIPDMG